VKKNKLVAVWAILVISMLLNSGCALLGAAVSAGISYAIYKATNK
jgi:hypothetical protein